MGRALAINAAAIFLAGIAITVVEGTPSQLPGVALGSPVLLHAERTLALVVTAVATLSVVVRAARGRLPIELSTTGLRYESDTAEDVATAVADQQEQLDDLTDALAALAERLDTLSEQP
jgi:hypothetical protein